MKSGDLVTPGAFGAVTVYNGHPQPQINTTSVTSLTKLKVGELALVINVLGDFAIIAANSCVGFVMVAQLKIVYE